MLGFLLQTFTGATDNDLTVLNINLRKNKPFQTLKKCRPKVTICSAHKKSQIQIWLLPVWIKTSVVPQIFIQLSTHSLARRRKKSRRKNNQFLKSLVAAGKICLHSFIATSDLWSVYVGPDFFPLLCLAGFNRPKIQRFVRDAHLCVLFFFLSEERKPHTCFSAWLEQPDAWWRKTESLYLSNLVRKCE